MNENKNKNNNTEKIFMRAVRCDEGPETLLHVRIRAAVLAISSKAKYSKFSLHVSPLLFVVFFCLCVDHKKNINNNTR